MGHLRSDAGRAFEESSLTDDRESWERTRRPEPKKWEATPRQAEILELLWSGLGDKEVADRLNIGGRTVRTHLEILRRRWRQRSRVGLLRVWQELKKEHEARERN